MVITMLIVFIIDIFEHVKHQIVTGYLLLLASF